MRRFALISTIICLTAASAVACNKVENLNSSSDNMQSSESLQSESAEIVNEEIPTEKEPEILLTDEFEYEVIDGGAVITGYIGNQSDVVIPDTLGDAPVTEIGFYSFEAEYDIASVTLPDSIMIIGEGAFMDCTSLEEINIPETVVGIDRGAFVCCTSLKNLVIPESVKYIKEEAFTACESLTSLTINNSDLVYENWGIEELPELRIVAADGSSVAAWAESMGIFSAE